MADSDLRQAVSWVMQSTENAKRFQANATVLRELFPDLSDDEMTIMEKIREQSARIEQMQGENGTEVLLDPNPIGGGTGTRSYGW
jgi:hypothetical protein